MSLQQKTAVLFFCRSARIDAREKNLLKGKSFEQNTELLKSLTAHAFIELRKTGLDIFHVDENDQVGNNFGAKIANAFDDIFNKGYSSVICVGNDTPSLGQINWEQIVSTLQNNKSIIGPDQRNGAYLIGLTKSGFSKQAFQNLRWQSRFLIDDLRHFTSTYSELATKADINSWTDINQLIEKSPFLKNLLRSINKLIWLIKTDQVKALPSLLSNHGLRAPPYRTC